MYIIHTSYIRYLSLRRCHDNSCYLNSHKFTVYIHNRGFPRRISLGKYGTWHATSNARHMPHAEEKRSEGSFFLPASLRQSVGCPSLLSGADPSHTQLLLVCF
uniref:Uncharacterized protein n=1 Tax=Zea mays TaxID=4577 RepID=C4J8P9_MAIZE|nr:unknown [Zea mays]